MTATLSDRGKRICGILTAVMSSQEDAAKSADRMKDCPYLIACGISDHVFRGVYVVPESRRWWLNYPANHPDIIGAQTVRVEVIEAVTYPESLPLRMPPKRPDVAPCGANCDDCPLRRQFSCDGCPVFRQ